jgi:hypothetical protein
LEFAVLIECVVASETLALQLLFKQQAFGDSIQAVSMHRKSNAFYSFLLLLVILTVYGSTAGQYISADTYTRYELLAPETHQFKIYYEVTETRVGARYHFNQIREGSEASDESPARRPGLIHRRRISAPRLSTSKSFWPTRLLNVANIVWRSSRLTRTTRVITPKATTWFSNALWEFRVTASFCPRPTKLSRVQ